MLAHIPPTPAALIAALSRDLVAAAGHRRQGAGRGSGARAPIGLAARPIDLMSLSERRPAGPELITPLGLKTAVRRIPPVLSGLDRNDARLIAVNIYLNATESLGAVAGIALDATPGGGGGGVPDGGAARRAASASALRRAHGAINRWKWDRARRAYVSGPERVILAPARAGKPGDQRRAITARALLDLTVIEGLDLAAILTRHGWGVHSKRTAILAAAMAEILGDLIDALGLSLRRAQA